MISIEQINGEISVLEEQIPTHAIMNKLAALYVVRDHMGIAPTETNVVQTNEIPELGVSEFLRTISKHDIRSVMMQMDELMTTLQVLNPNLYTSVMRNLNDTH